MPKPAKAAAPPEFPPVAGHKSKTYEDLLHEEVAGYYADPLGFVMAMFPWGEPGTLEAYDGPDEWQCLFLVWLGEQVEARGFDGVKPVLPIRRSVSSGHGIGKTVLMAMIVIWAMSTRPDMQGTVTANTMTQLETKTWAAIRTWLKRCKTSHWFDINSERMYRLGSKESWFIAKQSSDDKNSEAFQGQHAASSTSLYIFDEASAIPDSIHKAAEGGLTDGEPIILKFGNPTRSDGQFHVETFGAQRHRWNPLIIDSRECRHPNKETIAEWEKDYGEDSDFMRVRVRGLPPKASDLQFIDTARVHLARTQEVRLIGDEPLVVGLDVARGGGDNNVFRFRVGRDARSIPPIRIPGEKTRDSMLLVAKAAEVLDTLYDGRKVEMMFIDGTGIGGPICDRLKQLGHKNVVEVQFGGESPEPKYANMRAFMWGKMREWLPIGAIDKSPELETDLTGPGYTHDKQDRVLLESKEQMKKRDVASPDDGDALALTFAAPVVAKTRQRHKQQRRGRFQGRGGQPSSGGGLGWMSKCPNAPSGGSEVRRKPGELTAGCRGAFGRTGVTSAAPITSRTLKRVGRSASNAGQSFATAHGHAIGCRDDRRARAREAEAEASAHAAEGRPRLRRLRGDGLRALRCDDRQVPLYVVPGGALYFESRQRAASLVS